MTVDPEQPAPASWRATSTAWRWTVAVVFLVGLAIRLPGLADPPLEFAEIRQLHSAGLARGYYLAGAEPEDQPPGRVAAAAVNREPEIEPPIMERLAVLGYEVLGEEKTWWPRALSVAWWTTCGVLVLLLTLRLFGEHGALVATTCFVLLPFGVRASRSFQPDPLMVLLIVATALAATSAAATLERRRQWTTVLLASAAIFVKLVAAFFALPVLVVLAVHSAKAPRDRIRSAATWCTVAVLPAAAWYVWGTYISGFLAGQDDGRIEPGRLRTTGFWEGWAKRAADVLPVPRPAALLVLVVLVVLVAGALRTRDRWVRLLLGALAAGYVAFGLVFTVHYSTHDYYQLPVVAVIAIALGLAWSRVAERLSEVGGLRASWMATWLALVALAIPILWEWSSFRPTDDEIRRRVEGSEAIGDLVQHSAAVLYVADDFGLSLLYYGDVSGTLWESGPGESPEDTFERLQPTADYLAITDAELDDARDVEAIVAGRYALLSERDGWAVYDLRQSDASSRA